MPKARWSSGCGSTNGLWAQKSPIFGKTYGKRILTKWKNLFFQPLSWILGKIAVFLDSVAKNVRFFVIWLFFPEKPQGFTSGLWAQKLLAPFCNFDTKNSASGQAETSENESASSDKAWLESLFAKLGTGQVNFVPSGFWVRFWFKIAPQLMKNPHLSASSGQVDEVTDGQSSTCRSAASDLLREAPPPRAENNCTPVRARSRNLSRTRTCP